MKRKLARPAMPNRVDRGAYTEHQRVSRYLRVEELIGAIGLVPKE